MVNASPRPSVRSGALLAAAPAIWAIHLLTVYAMVPHACGGGSAWPIHTLTVVAVAGELAIAAAARRALRFVPAPGPVLARHGGVLQRAMAGYLALLFAVTVAVAGAGALIVGACQ